MTFYDTEGSLLGISVGAKSNLDLGTMIQTFIERFWFKPTNRLFLEACTYDVNDDNDSDGPLVYTCVYTMYICIYIYIHTYTCEFIIIIVVAIHTLRLSLEGQRARGRRAYIQLVMNYYYYKHCKYYTYYKCMDTIGKYYKLTIIWITNYYKHYKHYR